MHKSKTVPIRDESSKETNITDELKPPTALCRSAFEANDASKLIRSLADHQRRLLKDLQIRTSPAIHE